MVNLELAIRTAQPADQSRLANLLYFESYVHRHLDWRTPLDWLGVPEYWVAEQNGQINAALACPPDPEDIAWIRLFVRSNAIPAGEAWNGLWETARRSLAGRHGLTVAAIVIHDWFQKLVESSGFEQGQQIVLLEHTGNSFYEQTVPAGIFIRQMVAEDLPAVAQLDAEAFAPLWRNSLASLQRAFAQAGPATVAFSGGRMLGYQISTKNSFGVHLARLAVSPDFQGRSLGYSIIQDLLHQIYRMGIFRLTVNTQSDNGASLALYQRIGFVPTGESYPVFTFKF
jgi:[ribosomal protein S18]-alanine N-acetyltransferase